MKSRVQTFSVRAGRPHWGALAALGLAAAVLIAWPGRSHASEQHARAFSGASHGYAGRSVGHAVRADWHGGGGFRAAGPGYRGAVGVGWSGGGRWDHGWHGGHFGWWYIDAGVWTPYPYYYPYGYYPYYGYPAPYGYVPPVAPVVNSTLPQQPQNWYYCDAARAYYPYVQSCPGGWRPVAAQPPAPDPAPARAPAPAPAPAAPQ